MKRYEILAVIEKNMREYLGIDGHACMLRMLCETAQVGREHVNKRLPGSRFISLYISHTYGYNAYIDT